MEDSCVEESVILLHCFMTGVGYDIHCKRTGHITKQIRRHPAFGPRSEVIVNLLFDGIRYDLLFNVNPIPNRILVVGESNGNENSPPTTNQASVGYLI